MLFNFGLLYAKYTANIRAVLAIFIAGTLIGCLKEEKAVESSTSAPTFFSGALSAISKGDTSQVTWNRTADVLVSEFRVYLVLKTGELKLLQRLSATASKYIHTGLTAGQTYRYIVRAVDILGIEDGNTKIVGTINYPGVQSAIVVGSNLQVNLKSLEGDIQEVRIYAQYTGGVKKLVQTVSPTLSATNLSNLRRGVTYTISAQAYNDIVGEDGNTVTKSVQSPNLIFASASPRFRGYQNAIVYGDVPSWSPFDPDGDRIKTRQATIQWVQFALASASTKYRLLRTDAGKTIDFSVTSVCSASTVGTCLVCDTTYPTNSCRDITIEKGKSYDYVVTGILKDIDNYEYPEEIPVAYNPMSDETKASVGDYTPYRLQVSTPPDNMVMIPRDGVNYEYCTLLGRAPRVDRNMSCSFTGPGGKPTRVGQVGASLSADALQLENGYFDIGYNFMMDRFGQACNWSRKCSLGDPNYGTHKCGKCGPGGSDGDCIGKSDLQSTTAVPSNSLGVVGNIMYVFSSYQNSICWVKTRSTGTGHYWEPVENMSLNGTQPNLSAAITAFRNQLNDQTFSLTTNSPKDGYSIPIIAADMSSKKATSFCSATTSEYGTHRPLRLIEARASMSAPWIQDDINYKSDTTLNEVETGASGATYSDLSNNPIMGCQGWAYSSGALSSYANKFNYTVPLTNIGGIDQFEINSIYSNIKSTNISSVPQNLYKGTHVMPYERVSLTYSGICNGANPAVPPCNLGASYVYFLGAFATSQCVSRYGVEGHLTTPWITGETIPLANGLFVDYVGGSPAGSNARLTTNVWNSCGTTLAPYNDNLVTFRTDMWNRMKTYYQSLDVPQNYTSVLDPGNDSMAGMSFGLGRTIFLPSAASVFTGTSYAGSSGVMTSDPYLLTGNSSKAGIVGSILLKPDDPLNIDGLTPHGLPVSKTRSDTSLQYIPSSQLSSQISGSDIWAVFPMGLGNKQNAINFIVGIGRRWSTGWFGDESDGRNLTIRCAVPIRPTK